MRDHSMTFDDYCAAVREANVSFVVTRREEGSWGLEYIQGSFISVQFGSDGGASIADGITRPDALVILCRHGPSATKIRMNGQVIDHDDFVLLAPGGHFIFSADGPRSWISVSIPLKTPLHDHNALRLWPSDRTALQQSAVIGTTPGRMSAFVSCAEQLRNVVAGRASKSARATAEANLIVASLDILSELQPAQFTSRVGQLHEAYKSVSKALLTLHSEELGDRWYVADLALATDVGPRTLLRSFQSILGMGPVRYLRCRQLNLIRRQLRAFGHESGCVTAAMKAAGVSEFGRMAGAYKSLFGELPIETLRLAKSPANSLRGDTSAKVKESRARRERSRFAIANPTASARLLSSEMGIVDSRNKIKSP